MLYKHTKNTENQLLTHWFSVFLSGVGEIRTREPLLTVTRFPGVPLQPLEHHSRYLQSKERDCFYGCKGMQLIRIVQIFPIIVIGGFETIEYR